MHLTYPLTILQPIKVQGREVCVGNVLTIQSFRKEREVVRVTRIDHPSGLLWVESMDSEAVEGTATPDQLQWPNEPDACDIGEGKSTPRCAHCDRRDHEQADAIMRIRETAETPAGVDTLTWLHALAWAATLSRMEAHHERVIADGALETVAKLQDKIALYEAQLVAANSAIGALQEQIDMAGNDDAADARRWRAVCVRHGTMLVRAATGSSSYNSDSKPRILNAWADLAAAEVEGFDQQAHMQEVGVRLAELEQGEAA